ANLVAHPPQRVEGTAIFLTPSSQLVPPSLLHNLKHNKVLHERNVLLTVETCAIPFVAAEARLRIETIGDDFHRATIRYGFMETPDVPLALMRSGDGDGLCFDPMDTTYFASRESIVASPRRGMPMWRDRLFGYLHRNAAPATDYFRIPTTRLVELGSPVEI
ncbi:MAG TPA: KUP/HAK/KT family potassium transporter, partial [Pseudoxanthomonas sp.]